MISTRHIAKCRGLARLLSTSPARQERILFEQDNATGIATLSLNHPPVNSLGLEFMQDIIAGFDRVERESKGLVLATANKSIFSAGLDLTEMHNPDDKRIREFWHTFQEMWLRLYNLKVPAAAAISGHAPAGGALLAVSCDYRAMVASDKFTIGLNETKFGLVAPFWFVDSFVAVVGQRQAEMALQMGKLFSVKEAQQVGLIDEIVPDKQAAINTCVEMIEKFNGTVPEARRLTKMVLRKAPIDRLLRDRQQDVDTFVKFIFRDDLQKSIDAYMALLSKKR